MNYCLLYFMTNKQLILTKEQHDVVNNKGSELLIRGIAGSGKTLVLLSKAKKTADKYPEEKVVIFTYAGSLSNSTKYLVEKYSIGNLEVKTFHSWAMGAFTRAVNKKYWLVKGKQQNDFIKKGIDKVRSSNSHRFLETDRYFDFLKEEIQWIKGKGIQRKSEYLDANRKGRGTSTRVTLRDREIIFEVFEAYNTEKGYRNDFDDAAVTLFLNKEKISEQDKYDHIFVDEAQDFQQIQMQVLKSIAKKSLIIAADKGQKIYKTSFTWKEIGVNITGGRTKVLKESHRSTKQIIELANSLQQHDSIIYDEEYVAPSFPTREGPIPIMYQCNSQAVQDNEVIKSIKEILKSTPECTIGILYRNGLSWKKDSSRSRIFDRLKAEGYQAEDIREGANPHTPGIKLCTFHSAKGLEFDFVFLIDLVEPSNIPDDDKEENFWEIERRLFYVSITRARAHLQLFTHGKSIRLLKELDSQFYNSERLN